MLRLRDAMCCSANVADTAAAVNADGADMQWRMVVSN